MPLWKEMVRNVDKDEYREMIRHVSNLEQLLQEKDAENADLRRRLARALWALRDEVRFEVGRTGMSARHREPNALREEREELIARRKSRRWEDDEMKYHKRCTTYRDVPTVTTANASDPPARVPGDRERAVKLLFAVSHDPNTFDELDIAQVVAEFAAVRAEERAATIEECAKLCDAAERSKWELREITTPADMARRIRALGALGGSAKSGGDNA